MAADHPRLVELLSCIEGFARDMQVSRPHRRLVACDLRRGWDLARARGVPPDRICASAESHCLGHIKFAVFEQVADDPPCSTTVH
jgi:hypothetical protein